MTVLYYEPVFYGIRDVTIAADGGDFAARVYFPSHDGAVWTAPIRPGTYPLVVFAHGDRSSETDLCPPDRTEDHTRWDAVLHLLARCGFVVLAPAVHDVINSSEATAARLETATDWIRSSGKTGRRCAGPQWPISTRLAWPHGPSMASRSPPTCRGSG